MYKVPLCWAAGEVLLEVDVSVISVSVECSRIGMSFDFYTDHMVRSSTIAFRNFIGRCDSRHRVVAF